MVEQVFAALFVLTLMATPAAVVVGVALLAWPRRIHAPRPSVGHHRPAHV